MTAANDNNPVRADVRVNVRELLWLPDRAERALTTVLAQRKADPKVEG